MREESESKNKQIYTRPSLKRFVSICTITFERSCQSRCSYCSGFCCNSLLLYYHTKLILKISTILLAYQSILPVFFEVVTNRGF